MTPAVGPSGVAFPFRKVALRSRLIRDDLPTLGTPITSRLYSLVCNHSDEIYSVSTECAWQGERHNLPTIKHLFHPMNN